MNKAVWFAVGKTILGGISIPLFSLLPVCTFEYEERRAKTLAIDNCRLSGESLDVLWSTSEADNIRRDIRKLKNMREVNFFFTKAQVYL